MPGTTPRAAEAPSPHRGPTRGAGQSAPGADGSQAAGGGATPSPSETPPHLQHQTVAAFRSGRRPTAWVVTDVAFIAAVLGTYGAAFVLPIVSLRWEEPWAQRTALSERAGVQSGHWRRIRLLDLRHLRLGKNATAVSLAGNLPPSARILTAGDFSATRRAGWAAAAVGACWLVAIVIWGGVVACLANRGLGGPWLAGHFGDPGWRAPCSLQLCLAQYGMAPVGGLALAQVFLQQLLVSELDAEFGALCGEARSEWRTLQAAPHMRAALRDVKPSCALQWNISVQLTWAAVALSGCYALAHVAQDCTGCCCEGERREAGAAAPPARGPNWALSGARVAAAHVVHSLGAGDAGQSRKGSVDVHNGALVAGTPRADTGSAPVSPPLCHSEQPQPSPAAHGQLQLRVGAEVSFRADGRWQSGAVISKVYPGGEYAVLHTSTRESVTKHKGDLAPAGTPAREDTGTLLLPSAASTFSEDNGGAADSGGTLRSIASERSRDGRPNIAHRRLSTAGRRLSARAGELHGMPQRALSPAEGNPRGMPEIVLTPTGGPPGSGPSFSSTAQLTAEAEHAAAPLGDSSGESPASDRLQPTRTRRWLAKWSERRAAYFYYPEDELGDVAGPTVWVLPKGGRASRWEGGPQCGAVDEAVEAAAPPILLGDSRCPWHRCLTVGDVYEHWDPASSLQRRVRTVARALCVYGAHTDPRRYDAPATVDHQGTEPTVPHGEVPSVTVRFGDGAQVQWPCCDLLVHAPPRAGSFFIWHAMDRKSQGSLTRRAVHSFLLSSAGFQERTNWVPFVAQWQQGDPEEQVTDRAFCTAWDRAFGKRAQVPSTQSNWAPGDAAYGLPAQGRGAWRCCVVLRQRSDGCFAVLWTEPDGTPESEGCAVVLWRSDTPPPFGEFNELQESTDIAHVDGSFHGFPGLFSPSPALRTPAGATRFSSPRKAGDSVSFTSPRKGLSVSFHLHK
eukprot:TRINITY_DN16930_c0_g1_i1.p1 TRINITY_DN16930_c0_g1~~TRINITY_DN16930_c0_g1_i1.p1  ORF type:complete len:982 (+),score=229.65 TRINITY_DN16930_c0_g1_i1:68-2947(+)